MYLNNFRHNLSTTLMAQTFVGFNNLCTKSHKKELHLNKRKKLSKESARLGIIWWLCLLILAMVLKLLSTQRKKAFTQHESKRLQKLIILILILKRVIV